MEVVSQVLHTTSILLATMAKCSGSHLYSAVKTHEDEFDERNNCDLKTRYSLRNEVEVEPEVEAAVVVRNGVKWYTAGKPILSGLNMTVPCGSIYALLGSSGCGKTSLLSCIVGIRKLNQGSVWVFGEKPGTNGLGVPGKNIGYMPQEISLYEEFSVWETLNYFGTFSGMTEEQVGTELKFLVNLLDLPPLMRRVGTLSGGQKRRVSFAAAMIHNPLLLILDEPTVGVDPLLCQQIWTYLAKLVTRRNATVIITTHYIEEARQANMIGVIRNGRMIAEDSPQKLIDEFTPEGNGSLEKAVLKLCKDDSLGESENGGYQRRSINSNRKLTSWDMKRNGSLSEHHPDVVMATVAKKSDEASLQRSVVRIKALARKNINILIRNVLLLLFVVWIPAVELIFVGIAFGSEPESLKIGVVNYEVNKSACSGHIPRLGKCDLTHLSCSYLSHIPTDTIELEPFETQKDAEDVVHLGEIWGYLIFPEDFSYQLYQSVVLGARVDEDVLSSRNIIGKLDETNKHISTTIKIGLYKALSEFTSSFLSNCGIDPRQSQPSLRYQAPIYGKDETDLMEYATPSMAVASLFFFPIISIGIRFIEERKCGMLERSLVAGVRTWEIIMAYFISEFFVLVTQSLLVVAVLTLISDIKILGSGFLVVALFVVIGYCGVSLGFLFGSFCREKIDVAILAMACFMPNMILCGIFWPVQGMPELLQNVVTVFPCTLPSESIRSIISRGWDISHYSVWIGFVVMFAHIIFNLLMTILFHKL